MKKNHSVWLVAVFVGTIAFVAAPRHAHAQTYFGTDAVGDALFVASSVTVGVPALIFTVADIVSFAGDTPFSTEWAVLETISASLTIIAGGVFFGGGIPRIHQDIGGDGGLMFGVGCSLLALGGLNLAHAIWSFVNHRSAESEDGAVTTYVVPQQGGLLAGVGGTF